MGAIIIILLLLFLVLMVLPFVALAKASAAESRVTELAAHLAKIDVELHQLRQSGATGGTRLDDLARQVTTLQLEVRLMERAGAQAPSPMPLVPAPAEKAARNTSEKNRFETAASGIPSEAPIPQPPPTMPPPDLPKTVFKFDQVPERNETPPPRSEPVVQAPATEDAGSFDWEQFMGAKLFAWIGGLALFLGIAFFIKYSFDHNMIPPQVRVTLGFLAGLGLLLGGTMMKRKETLVTAQTLCSTGVLVLYGVTFACRALYHFAFFDTVPTFLLMSLITAVAFLLSVGMNAMVVAVLGIAGGFMTPVLLSTGQDSPLVLFSYIALLDLGLLAVALRMRWKTLPALGAIGTVLTQIGWIATFFVSERYFAGNKVLVTMVVLLGFQALFLASAACGTKTKRLNSALSFGAVLLGGIAMLAGFYFLQFEPLAQRPILLFGYVLLVDLGLLALEYLDNQFAPVHSPAGAAAFVLLAVWTGHNLTPAHLDVALGSYFVFALLHTAAPLAMNRLRGTPIPGWCSIAPALALVLPFLLLMMVVVRLPLANPSPVFALALLLVVLLLGLTRVMALEPLPVIGLACVVALEQTWQLGHFNPVYAALPLAWFLVFYGVFMVFPFLFRRQFAKSTLPWAAAALAGPAHFYLLHHLVRAAYPSLSGLMGLLPAAFSVPALLGVMALAKSSPADNSAHDTQLAWFGGIALFFITLIFPIQFERQWITLGWALEGMALCWLFRRVPHPGLRLTGVGLLLAAFVRLALNPAVVSYHAHSSMPLLNWYLYAYGVTGLCLFGAARLLAPPRNEVAEFNVPPLLWGLGTLLLFLLVNIEIADFFSQPGASALTFQFSGDFARDMTYSIAWALFALLLLVIGIARRLAPVRYASIGLLAVTLLKLFLHDLSELDQLYRIAAFIVVALIAMLASFLYQRFFGTLLSSEQPPCKT
jgi:uncharacterized membrane protein